MSGLAESSEPERVALFEGYEPHDGQRQLHESGAQRLAVTAGRRGGKTYGGGREFLRRVFKDLEQLQERGEADWSRPRKFNDRTKPLLHYWLVAPTYDHTGYQMREVYEALGAPDSPLVLEDRPSAYELWLKGGIKIEQKSAERPERLVAAGLDGAWFDEAARFKEDTWSDHARPALSDNQGWALFTTTPLGTSNWYYEEIWSKTESDDHPDYRGVKFHTADNTAVPGLQEEVERARRELPDAMFRRNYRADFHAFKGQIYTEFFAESPHVVSKVPVEFVRRLGCIDWGWSNPGVLLEVGIDADGRWWVYDEHYHRDMLKTPPDGGSPTGTWLGVFRAAMRRGVERFWADPSEPETIETFRQHGIPVRPALNTVAPGIDAVKTMFHDGSGSPQLRIHERCRTLIREVGSYKWKDDKEEPVKENDHGPDALRYGVYTEHEHERGRGIDQLDDFSIFN